MVIVTLTVNYSTHRAVETIGSGQFEPQPVHLGEAGATAVQSHESQFETVR